MYYDYFKTFRSDKETNLLSTDIQKKINNYSAASSSKLCAKSANQEEQKENLL